MPKNKSWFRMAKKDDTAEIEIFDEVDSFWGIGPSDFKKSLDEVKGAKSIKLLINSPGGSIFDGMAIYNMLAGVKDKLEVEVIGLAASIASIIAMSGSKLTIANGAYLMIHNPWTVMAGGSEDLRKTADLLDKMKADFVSIYKGKSGLDEKELVKLMDDETWMTSDEAMEYGFADDVEDYGDIAAKVSAHSLEKFGYTHAPKIEASTEKIVDPRELENVLRDAGYSRKVAVAIASTGLKVLGQSDSVPEDQSDSDQPEPVDVVKDTDWIKAKMSAEVALQDD